MSGHQVVFIEKGVVSLVPFTPRSPGEGELLIKTKVTLISTGTELTALTGDFPPASFWAAYVRYPFIAGYSNVGIVEKCGPGVVGFKPGDLVTSSGPHATWAVVSAQQAMRIPDNVTPEAATFWNLGKTVMNGVRLAHIALGESVVIIGAGILGNLASQYASLCGARPVIVVDKSDERLNHIVALPGIQTILSDENLETRVVEMTGGRKANVVFEVTGSADGLRASMKLAGRRGRVIVLGSPRGPASIDFHDEVHRLGLQIIGAHVSTHPETETPYNEWTPQRNGQCFLDLLSRGELHLDSLVTHRFPWREAPEAYRQLIEDRTCALGVLLEWD